MTVLAAKPPMARSNVHASITRLELFIYAIFFVSIVAIGLRNIYDNATEIVLDAPSYLWENPNIAGRFVRNHFQDIGDYEWQSFEGHWLSFLICGLFNASATWLLAKTNFHRYRNWSAAICGFVTMIVTCGVYNTAIFAAEHVAVYATMRISRLPLIFGWLVAGVHMFAPYPTFLHDGPYYAGSDFAIYFTMIAWGWNVMRYASFGSEWQWHLEKKRTSPTVTTEENSNEKQQENQDGGENLKDIQQQTNNVTTKRELNFGLIDFLGYMWYTPSIFGSIITYRHFYEQVVGKRRKFQFLQPLFLRQLAIIAGWLVFTLIYNELFMIYTLGQHESQLHSLNNYGIAWAHGQYFQAKYMVLYGLPWLLAFLDHGVELTPLPICISRVYLCSNLWKYFDTGLYDFLKNYIYAPLTLKFGGKLLPAAVTFLFICIWHGANKAMAIWAVGNFVQVALESLFRHASNNPKSWIYTRIRSRISTQNWRRLEALTCAFSFALSSMSHAFFLLTYQPGSYVVSRAFSPITVNFWFYIITSYAWIQTIFSFENWRNGFKF